MKGSSAYRFGKLLCEPFVDFRSDYQYAAANPDGVQLPFSDEPVYRCLA
jgi:hypothetical protein